MTKKVFVSGCYDLLHSGHVEFFQQASQYGDLYVGIGSDATYLEYKHRKPMFPQEERLFMVKNIKAVKDALIALFEIPWFRHPLLFCRIPDKCLEFPGRKQLSEMFPFQRQRIFAQLLQIL